MLQLVGTPCGCVASGSAVAGTVNRHAKACQVTRYGHSLTLTLGGIERHSLPGKVGVLVKAGSLDGHCRVAPVPDLPQEAGDGAERGGQLLSCAGLQQRTRPARVAYKRHQDTCPMPHASPSGPHQQQAPNMQARTLQRAGLAWQARQHSSGDATLSSVPTTCSPGSTAGSWSCAMVAGLRAPDNFRPA